jgi:hypothetical protein
MYFYIFLHTSFAKNLFSLFAKTGTLHGKKEWQAWLGGMIM